MLWFLLFALAAPAPPSDAAVPLQVGGRAEREADGSLRFGWPGIYFEGRFGGTGVSVATDSATEHFRLLVDGEEKAIIREAGAATVSISGLTDEDHVVRLEKLTESQSGGGRFLGFRAAQGARLLPAMPRQRQIEFIGDSYTVGYGNMSSVRTCTRDEVHDLTNTQLAFGPLLARRLDADYRVHAYSGFGIVRNYNGGSPDLSLPSIYGRMLPGEPGTGSPSNDGWDPQLIVINLGTNDFSTPLNAGERWASQEALRSDYRNAYAGFLRKLMKTHPRARFILMGSDAFITEVDRIAVSLDAAARPRVTTLRFTGLDLMGCDWHPSLADHRALVQLLAGALNRTGLDWTPAVPASVTNLSSNSS